MKISTLLGNCTFQGLVNNSLNSRVILKVKQTKKLLTSLTLHGM